MLSSCLRFAGRVVFALRKVIILIISGGEHLSRNGEHTVARRRSKAGMLYFRARASLSAESSKMSAPGEKRSRLSHVARWAAELLLVFIGVYAAFWLNNYQQHRQDAKRRQQILAAIERTLREGIESGKINRAEEEREAAEFQHALDAGEMPALQPFVFTTDYSPGDFAALLQAGGVELLDVETLMALRNDESVIRWGLSRLERYQKLSDTLIVPNLDQDISFFYDPLTRKLRKRFQIYPDALQATVKFARDLERTHTELLKRIQAERRRRL
jgi:hypothetical protein